MQAELIDRAVENIADGQAVNWDLLDSQAQDEEERKQLKWLRVLEEIANLHRSTVDPAADSVDMAASQDAGDMPPAAPRFGRRATDRIAGSGSAPAAESSPGVLSQDRDPHAAADADAAPAVQTWGRYHLLEKVGEGSFGSVYRAWDPQLEREIGIKILHRHVTDDRLRDRLLREGRALARIRHTNVVSVLDVESHEERIGLAMEFVRGLTLEDVLSSHGMLSARETVVIGEDVCRALAAVHNAGFVHRDVKARNVMREQAGRIVLMDFGTGREMRALEETKRPDVVGTPLYMAPELLGGETASTRSDVYSVGVLLYHLATAQYPIKAKSVDDLRDAHKQQRRRFLSECRPDLPMAFVRVVERALATDPQERYPNAGALLNALGGVLGDRPEPRRSLLSTVGIATLLGVGLLVAMPIALGFGNWIGLNATLERSDFSNEGVRDWWIWGVRSTVAPIVALLVSWFALVVFKVIRGVVLAMSETAVRLDERVWERGKAIATRLSLDNVPVVASWVFLLSAGASVIAWAWYWPLMEAFGARISTAPAEQLALLSPAYIDHHLAYRKAFSAIVFMSIAGWYYAKKLSTRRGQPLNASVVAGGMAVVALAVVTLDIPYRLLFHNRWETAMWNGSRCYIIGERSAELLLFCPEAPLPRNVIVPKQPDGPVRGRRENIFTRFAPSDTSANAPSQTNR